MHPRNVSLYKLLLKIHYLHKMQSILFFKISLTFITTVMGMEYKNNGDYKIPVLGLGTFAAINETELIIGLNAALEIGYRHIDTSPVYGNEHVIGKVLQDWISSGKIKREDLFITSKLEMNDLFPDKVENALKTSLEKLHLDYLDLYLIHFPIAMKFENGNFVIQPTDLISVWKKMEEQVKAGQTRTIGVSNFNISQIQRIQKIARIQPVNVQVELNLYFQQKELGRFANKNNITVVAYSPLGAPGLNKFYAEAKFDVTAKLPDMLHDAEVTKIATKYKKSNAQIILKFLVQLGVVPIPKSTNSLRLKENINIFDFKLDRQDMKLLKGLDKGKKAKIFTNVLLPKGSLSHPEFPFYENL